MDKLARVGIRNADLLDKGIFERTALRSNLEEKKSIIYKNIRFKTN